MQVMALKLPPPIIEQALSLRAYNHRKKSAVRVRAMGQDSFTRTSPRFGRETDEIMTRLQKLYGPIHAVGTAAALVGWDTQASGLMPPNARNINNATGSALEVLGHNLLVAPAVGELLTTLRDPENYKDLSDVDQAYVRELGRRYDKAARISRDLVERAATENAKANTLWDAAMKGDGDFTAFAQQLETVVALQRETAKALGYAEGGTPYDALLDLYEPGMTVAQLDPVFEDLKQRLMPLVRAIREADYTAPDDSIRRTRKYSLRKQEGLSRALLEWIGFDFDRGRFSASTHPFTSTIGGRDNVRLTTRFSLRDFFKAIFPTLHEGGHGLYEQGTAPELAGTPLADGTSMGIHESQSRTWENIVGRSRAFWQYALPELQKVFPTQLAGVTVEDLYALANQVNPSLNRVEADEVTYNLHIVLRYEIERDLINGKMKAQDIPRVWNDKMQEYLGITPPDDKTGWAQDIHWSWGLFGYFPTYTLGNLYAAQFWKKAIQPAIPDLDSQFAQGNFQPLKQWLNDNIHRHGKMKSADQLSQDLTGESLNPTYFTDYLWEKFGPIYGIQRPAAA